MNLKPSLEKCMSQIAQEKIEVYNEFSLQHELGIFLRSEVPAGYKVQFECNVAYFGLTTKTVKKEIDISVFNGDKSDSYAIELKFPQNGQYPEQMFSFAKDIRFMEELKEAGFSATYCLTLVRDKAFYSGKRRDGIYSFFRGSKPAPVHGEITNPTGARNERFVVINGSYQIEWRDCGSMKYYVVEV